MATYAYRCPYHGDFETRFPIGTAERTVRCATCRSASPRVFTPPLVNATPRPLAAAVDRAGRSAETPEVVTRIPGRPPQPGTGRATTRPADPARLRLPRP
ncbi:zinc ribbon domain-containing protein [Micromonospora sp. NPDC050397]|uniref:zinc ribbon domain-containing protein n=1 Tax=Micromonospora sp. NPDC050397 TaxID=3364279 RepID=UPI00384F807F